MPSTTMIPTGSYAIKRFRSAGGDETVRFEAALTLNGQVVATVSNSGTGGSHGYRFIDGVQRDAFLRFVETHRTETFEADDAFVNDLISLFQLSGKRSVPFVLDGDDFFGNGQYRNFAATASFEQVLAELRTPKYAKANPLIFVKGTLSFVPVADVSA